MLLGKKAIGTIGILAGLPSVLTEFAWSWGELRQYCQEYMATDKTYVHAMRATFTDFAPARNMLAAKFLGDWLLMLDCDHQFPPDIAARLLRTADEFGIDVLSGLYQFKHQPHSPVLYQWADISGKPGLQPLATWPIDVRVLEIGSAGAGCLFVRRKVFEKIVKELNQQPFDKRGAYSEDHSFFDRCREVEIKCYAAMRVHCNHLRVVPVTIDQHDPSSATLAEQCVGGFA